MLDNEVNPSKDFLTWYILHTARKVLNSFQTLFNHIQGCMGCQMKQKTSMNMNLVVFCAKTQLSRIEKFAKVWKGH